MGHGRKAILVVVVCIRTRRIQQVIERTIIVSPLTNLNHCEIYSCFVITIDVQCRMYVFTDWLVSYSPNTYSHVSFERKHVSVHSIVL